MYLVIDISNFKGFELTLFERANARSFFDKKKYDLPSDQLLASIKKFLFKNKLSIDDLGGIAMTHAGSFTTERTAAVLINTIGYAKNIPVVTLNKDDDAAKKLKLQKRFIPIKPVYTREPNITVPKKQAI